LKGKDEGGRTLMMASPACTESKKGMHCSACCTTALRVRLNTSSGNTPRGGGGGEELPHPSIIIQKARISKGGK
jgi:hypothetical protein